MTIPPNGFDREEHDGDVHGKNVSIVKSTATLFAVVNTGAAGGQASVVVDGPVSIKGNLTLSDSKTFIGLTTTVIGNTTSQPIPIQPPLVGYLVTSNVGNVTIDSGNISLKGNITISDSKGFIGLTTTVIGSAPTIYAVVNTQATASSNVTLDPGSKTGIVGNVTLSDSKTFIGLTTVVQASSVRSIAGNVTLSDSKGFIGLVTIGGGTIGTTFAGNVTLDPGSKTQIVGNVTLSDPKGFIGLVTIGGGTIGTSFAGNITLDAGSKTQIVGNVSISSNVAWPDPKGYIGLVTITGSLSAPAGNVTLDAGSRTGIVGNVTLSDSKTFIGLVTVGNTVSTTFSGNVTLSDAKTFIGLVTVVQSSAARSILGNVCLSSQVAWNNPNTYIGLATVTPGRGHQFIGLVTCVMASAIMSIAGNITLSDSKTFIGLNTVVNGAGNQFMGLVTAWTRNAGTTKTLIPVPVAMSTSSQATIAVPATNLSIYVTSVLLSSNATVRVSIKSGVTYLTGNASIGITINPGGGWVETGAPDAPVYMSTPSASINIEKFDMTGTIASLAGKIIYYTE